MKVLYALDSLNRGGAETHVLDVCRNAANHGIEPILVALGGGSLFEEFNSGGFKFRKLERSSSIDISVIRGLREIFRDEKIQIAHGFQPIEMIHLYLASLGTNVKCVQTHQGFIEGWKNRFAARLISPRMDANISVSKSLKPWLASNLKVDAAGYDVVYNTVDESRLTLTGDKLRDEFGDPALLCGMVSNFQPTPTKDQLTVCRALPAMFERFPDSTFVFVGRVSAGAEHYHRECVAFCEEAGIADRVYFAGARDDVPEILRSLDVFVFSSRQEGLPVAVIEAMMCGLPVLVSDIEPLLEVTDEGKHGRVFKTGDAVSLADEMIKLVEHRDSGRELGAAGQEFARKHFSLSAHFESLNEIYTRLVR